MGERENGRARGRHACLFLARPFFLVPTTSKHLLRRLTLTFRSWRDDFNKLILQTIPHRFFTTLLRRTFPARNHALVRFHFFFSFSLSPAYSLFLINIPLGLTGGGGWITSFSGLFPQKMGGAPPNFFGGKPWGRGWGVEVGYKV